MKTVLRSMLFIALLGLSAEKITAQCTVSDIVIQNVSIGGSTPTTCTVTFDASFTIENNNGNKYIFIHAWLQQDYPNYFHCVNGQTTLPGAIQAPKASDLGSEFLTIGINNDVMPPQLLTTYTPDPSVPVTPVASITRTVLANGSAVFTLHGITVTIPVPCGTPVVVVADLWSSQSAHAQVAHCVNCGIRYGTGYVRVTGLANCSNLTYSATITNNTGAAINGTYAVYADVNGDGVFTSGVDVQITSSTAFNVAAGIGSTTPISGSIPSANLGQDLFIRLTMGAGIQNVVLIPSTQCAPLPVTFKSFTATRTNRSTVSLKWETVTEINNSGFAIQRNMGNNEWQTVTFINSQAQAGNSNSLLTYTYTDMNGSKGITQYRIKQVDLDNKAKFSEIRAVRGDGQDSRTIVYPTPSADGRVNVIFNEKNGTRDIILTDMYGRTIRQWNGITGNTIQIDNLSKGMYSLRIVTRETGEQVMEKVMVGR